MRTKKGSFVCEKFDSEWMHDGKQGSNYVHWGVPVVDTIETFRSDYDYDYEIRTWEAGTRL